MVYITFPASFGVSSAAATGIGSVSGQTVPVAMSVAAGTNTVAITNVSLPTSAGGYGPFKIVTRQYDDGQIFDANYVFGSVGVADAPSAISNLAVAYNSGSTGNVNASSQSVNVSFTISKDLYKHDMFVIEFPSAFTVTTGATCSSYVTGQNDINYYNSTATETDPQSHDLNCKATDKVNTRTADTK
jgi:hypothetical protein